jgi:hypothetical protein
MEKFRSVLLQFLVIKTLDSYPNPDSLEMLAPNLNSQYWNINRCVQCRYTNLMLYSWADTWCTGSTEYTSWEGILRRWGAVPRTEAAQGGEQQHQRGGGAGGVHPQNVRFQNVWFQNVWNVRFTKRQVYKMSGLQNVRFSKRPVAKKHPYILYLWLEPCLQAKWWLCVLFSILEGFLAIYHHNE